MKVSFFSSERIKSFIFAYMLIRMYIKSKYINFY